MKNLDLLDCRMAMAHEGEKTAGIRRVIVRYLTVTLAILAVVVMGSENQWFPWPNFTALGVLVLIVWGVKCKCRTRW